MEERATAPTQMLVTSTIPVEGMDSLVEAMKSGMFDPAIKSITKLGGFTDATKRMQGVMVAVKNVIAFDYWPDHPRKLTLIYFTGVTHVIEEERRSFEDRPFLSASVCDAVLDEFPT